MRDLSDAHHFRKTIAGLCMVLAPLALLAGMVVHPERHTDESALLAAAADNLDRWYVAHLLLLVSLALAVPAVLGLMHMLREREAAYGHVGGGLVLLGLLAYVGVVTINGFVVWQMAAAGSSAGFADLIGRLNDTAGTFVPFFLASFAFALGVLVLAMGLYRARAVQSWMALFIALGAVLIAIGGPTASGVLDILGAAFMFVGLGSIGRLVLTESDEDWEHTPEYRGLRPLLGIR